MDLWAVLKLESWGELGVFEQSATQAEANKAAKDARKEDTDKDVRFFVAHLLSEARQNNEPILIVPLVKPSATIKKPKSKKK